MKSCVALLDGGYYAHWSAATRRPCDMAELVRRIAAAFGLHANAVELWLAEDCPRDQCWRRAVFPGYKRGRPVASASDRRTQKSATVRRVLSAPHLEADDCIAVAVCGSLLGPQSGHKVVIVSNDTDFLQLVTVSNRVAVVDMNMRPVRGHKGAACVVAKALGGDKTDGIPPAWRGCGQATVERCLRSEDYLRHKLSDAANLAGYNRNLALVDFAAIPERLTHRLIDP